MQIRASSVIKDGKAVQVTVTISTDRGIIAEGSDESGMAHRTTDMRYAAWKALQELRKAYEAAKDELARTGVMPWNYNPHGPSGASGSGHLMSYAEKLQAAVGVIAAIPAHPADNRRNDEIAQEILDKLGITS